MGLYRLACEYLKKAAENVFIDSLFTEFRRIADESRIERFALLLDTGCDFEIILNCGFNAETVRKSRSKRDFWDGVIQNNEWHSFSGDNLKVLYQLFSEQDARFDTLYIKKSFDTQNPFICIIAGEYPNKLYEALIAALLPLIARAYAVFRKCCGRSENPVCKNAEQLQKCKAFLQTEPSARLCIIRLGRLFESLFTAFVPSDFDFTERCIFSAVQSFPCDTLMCGIAEEKALVYTVFNGGTAEDFCAHIDTHMRKMFTPHRAELVRTEQVTEFPPSLSENRTANA